jgi:hypothetical protein
MKFIKKYIFDIFFLSILTLLIIFLSNFFSIYKADLHHWGFISSHALDYINGGKLFKEIFVQYGVGQLILFKFINFFYEINFTSTGTITSIVYSLNLIIIYFIIKKISSNLIAFYILITIFLTQPFISSPWPDYIAGLCLLLFCSFLIFTNSKGSIFFLLAGFFLFLSIIFRTSYILNIFAACSVYFFLIKINKIFYNKFLVRSLFTFGFLLIFYLFYLFFQNDFLNWIIQGISPIKDYTIISKSQYKIWVVNNLGENFFILLKLIIIILRFFAKLIFPTTLENLIILIFFSTNILFIFSYFNKSLKNFVNHPSSNNQNNHYLFIALLGFFGIVQSLFFFNFMKIINASSGILFTTAIFLKLLLNGKFLENKTNYFIIGFLFLCILSFKFINTLTTNFKIDINAYSPSSIDYFGKRKFIKEDLNYYNEVKQYVCKDNIKIINFTLDTNLVHLCSKRNISYHPYFFYLKKKNPTLYERINKGELYNNEIFITTKGPEHKKLKLYYFIKYSKNCCLGLSNISTENFFYIYLK